MIYLSDEKKLRTVTDAPLSSDSFSWVKILAREAKPRLRLDWDRGEEGGSLCHVGACRCFFFVSWMSSLTKS
jgi:hypothetical protein